LEAPLTGRKSESARGLATVVIWLTAVLLLIRLWLAGHLELMFDEAYYALWAKHLAWGYLDHPPMVALWIHLSTLLFGEHEFGVRALGVLAAAGGSGFVYVLSWLLFANRSKAAVAALFYCSMLLISVGAIIITPDTPLLFFWSIALYGLVRIYRGDGAGWWWSVGLAMGFALQSKYTALLLGAGIACAMVAVPKMRIWWRHLAPYLAGGLALAIFLPVVSWNYHHDWASFGKQLGRAQAERLTLRYVGEFAASQIGLLTPFVFTLAVAGCWLGLRRGEGKDRESRLLLIALIAPMFIYFLVHSVHDRVQGNWLAPAYPALAILASDAAFQIASFGERIRPLMAVCRRLAVPIGLGMTGIVYLQALAAPIPLDPAKDPTALLAGWSELAAKVETLARREGAGYLLTSSYALTSQLTYYSTGTIPIVQFNERLRWLSFAQPQPNILSQPGLYVAEAGRDLASTLAGRFSRITKFAEISRYRHGKQIQAYVLYRLEGPTAPILDAATSAHDQDR
jgi:4-amino-4-deoxy-L-arabinose transferase-like glycosyltransferase